MQPVQQDLLANGSYAPYLAQTFAPPPFGSPAMMGGYGGVQGINPQINPQIAGAQAFGQAANPTLGVGVQPTYGYPGWQPGFAQPLAGQQQQMVAQQLAAQQQQIAATLHQLAQQVATQGSYGQQICNSLQQLAQHVAQQSLTAQQVAAAISQLAQQCSWQAQMILQSRGPHFGVPTIQGQPWGYGAAGVTPFAQQGAFNRVLW